MKTTQELIPSLKPVYDRYKSGDIFKSSVGSEQGITSGGVRTTIAKHHGRYSKSDHLCQDGVE